MTPDPEYFRAADAEDETTVATEGNGGVLSVKIDGVWVPMAEVISSSLYVQVPKSHAMTTGFPSGLIIQSPRPAPFVDPETLRDCFDGIAPTAVVRDELYKWQQYDELLQARKITPNQIREAEGMNPIPGGEVSRPNQSFTKNEVYRIFGLRPDGKPLKGPWKAKRRLKKGMRKRA